MKKMKGLTTIICIFSVIFRMVSTGSVSTVAAEVTSLPDFTIEKTINRTSFMQGEKGIITYTVTPTGGIKQTIRQPADIVLVLDLSTSMTQAKLTGAKNAAKSFIDNIANNNVKDRIAVVTFGYKVSDVIDFTTNYQSIKNKINSFKADLMGTNYDDALHKAHELLSKSNAENKYVVFLSDGLPNYFTSETSIQKYNNNTYSRREGSKYYYTNHPNDTPRAYDDAREEARTLANNDILMYSIGLGTRQEVDMDFLEELAGITGGKAYHSQVPDELMNIFNAISHEITQTKISNMTIHEVLPDGISVANPNSVIILEDGTVQLKLPDIQFQAGQAAPQTRSISLEVVFNKSGSYTLDHSKIWYNGIEGNRLNKDINSISVTVYSNNNPPDMNVGKEISSTKLSVGDIATLKYTLTPTGAFVHVKRAPLDIVLIIDNSNSMTVNNKISNAKEAAKTFVKTFQEAGLGDRIAVVSFNKDAKKEQDLSIQYSSIISKIENIKCSTGTNYEAGLKKAKELLAGSERGKYIVFLSDGMPNYYLDIVYPSGQEKSVQDFYGIRPFEDARETAKDISMSGIKLYTVGVGTGQEIDVGFMEELAEIGGGKFYHSSNSEDLNDIYKEISDRVNAQKISEIYITEKLPEGIEVITENVTSEDNGIQFACPDIIFKEDGTTPLSIEKEIKLKFNVAGEFTLSPVTKVDYKDYEGNAQSKMFNSITVTVTNNFHLVESRYTNNDVDIQGVTVEGFKIKAETVFQLMNQGVNNFSYEYEWNTGQDPAGNIEFTINEANIRLEKYDESNGEWSILNDCTVEVVKAEDSQADTGKMILSTGHLGVGKYRVVFYITPCKKLQAFIPYEGTNVSNTTTVKWTNISSNSENTHIFEDGYKVRPKGKGI